MTRLLKTPIIGRIAAVVDSSRSDMLAGLSKWEILRTPPAFWANAESVAHSAISSAPAATSPRRPRFISVYLRLRNAETHRTHRCILVGPFAGLLLARLQPAGGYHTIE